MGNSVYGFCLTHAIHIVAIAERIRIVAAVGTFKLSSVLPGEHPHRTIIIIQRISDRIVTRSLCCGNTGSVFKAHLCQPVQPLIISVSERVGFYLVSITIGIGFRADIPVGIVGIIQGFLTS